MHHDPIRPLQGQRALVIDASSSIGGRSFVAQLTSITVHGRTSAGMRGKHLKAVLRQTVSRPSIEDAERHVQESDVARWRKERQP
jgi:hypothetical protein